MPERYLPDLNIAVDLPLTVHVLIQPVILKGDVAESLEKSISNKHIKQ